LSLDITKTILYGGATVVKFDRTTKSLREKLQRRNLIVELESLTGGKKGIYRFTEGVEKLRQALNGIYRCPECNSLMDYDYQEFSHVCKRCGQVVNYANERCLEDDVMVKFEVINAV
jgi:DNA gyrase inhibitor GyrI